MENDLSQSHEGTVALVCVALVVSVVLHLALMYGLSDCSISVFSAEARAAQRRRRQLPVMQVTRADAQERMEMRAARLEDASGDSRTAGLEGLRAGGELPPSAAADAVALAESAAKAPEARLPRQAILQVTAPKVPDELSALPRIYVPTERRAPKAPELDTGALRRAPKPVVVAEAAQGAGGKAAGAAAGPDPEGVVAFVPPPPPVAPTAPAVAANAVGVSPVVRPQAPAAAEFAPKRSPAPLAAAPAEMMARVDESVVEREKAAVRDLLGSQEGTSFEKNVAVGLDWWADPANGGRKYFRIAVTSDSIRPLDTISKDLVFLLDASGSIANDRLDACRAVVKDALRALNTGDRFNVVAFRDKFDYCFSAWQPVTKDSLKKADRWMDKLTAHGRTDVFATLRSIMTVPRDPARPVVALVVTDAEATAGLTQTKDILAAFTKLNGGLVSVYMYGVKERANKPLMDLLTRGNRGGWTYHPGDRKKAAEELNGFLETFHDPVLTDIRVIFSSASGVEAHPQLVRNLYRGQSVDIWGSCPADAKDVAFAVRGLNGADVFESVFRLPFSPDRAKLGAAAKAEWEKLRGYDAQLGALR